MDKTSMIQGWLVGRAIAGNRNKAPTRIYPLGRLQCSAVKFPKEYSHRRTWVRKEWSGLTSFQGAGVWSDGDNIYYSVQSNQYVLNGDTWEPKVWNGKVPSGTISCIWTDGTNIYYYQYGSALTGSTHYILEGDTWTKMATDNTWKQIKGNLIWSDGANIYYSDGYGFRVLNGDTWETLEYPDYMQDGNSIWSDGTHIFDQNSAQGEVMKVGDAWVLVTSDPEPVSTNGNHIWTDGTNVYYSYEGEQYVRNGWKWEPITWNGLTEFDGAQVWSDGVNIYYSKGEEHYVLT